MTGHIVRIQSTDGRTLGHQARVPIPGQRKRYVSRLFSDRMHGGEADAYRMAKAALPELRRLARRAAKS